MRPHSHAPRGAATALALAALFAVTAAAQEQTVEPLDAFPRSSLEIESPSGRQRLEVWIADTGSRRAQGLMYVEQLAPLHGMLFLYREPRVVSMWMKNTLIPLDMVFIAADGTIRHIHANAVPLSTDAIPSQFPVRAVLEINGGSARLLGIKPGDKVKHEIFGNAG